MISKWYEYKDLAISLRHQGKSIREIEKKLKIPRSTLSGWFKNIMLTAAQKNALEKRRIIASAEGRARAVLWHNKQKENRIIEAKSQANLTLKNITTKNKYVLELALAMLYLGEGS